MKKNSKILLICSITSFFLVSFSLGVGISYAAYKRTQTVKDLYTGSAVSVSGEGIRLTNYYLDGGDNFWKTLSSTHTYYALFFVNSDHTTFEYVLGVADGGNYRFTVDVVPYDRVQFITVINTGTPPTTFDGRAIDEVNVTNSTVELGFESNKTTYQITGWHGAGAFNQAPGYWR